MSTGRRAALCRRSASKAPVNARNFTREVYCAHACPTYNTAYLGTAGPYPGQSLPQVPAWCLMVGLRSQNTTQAAAQLNRACGATAGQVLLQNVAPTVQMVNGAGVLATDGIDMGWYSMTLLAGPCASRMKKLPQYCCTRISASRVEILAQRADISQNIVFLFWKEQNEEDGLVVDMGVTHGARQWAVTRGHDGARRTESKGHCDQGNHTSCSGVVRLQHRPGGGRTCMQLLIRGAGNCSWDGR